MTIFRENEPTVPIQLVLHVYTSISCLLASFDVDCCAIAYDPTAKKVWCTRCLRLLVGVPCFSPRRPEVCSITQKSRRCKRAVVHRANIFDTYVLSRSYCERLERSLCSGGVLLSLLCERLEKYANRGFAIAVPGYEEVSLSRRLLGATYFFVDRFGLLLRVDSPAPPANAVMSLGYPDMKTLNLHYTRAVRTTIVKDLARLVILSRGAFERLNLPSEQPLCATCQKPCVPEGGPHVAVPVLGQLPGECFLLYGVKHAAAHQQSSSQSTSARGDGEGCDDDEDGDDDEEGGAEDEHECYDKVNERDAPVFLFLGRSLRVGAEGSKRQKRGAACRAVHDP